MSTQGHSIPTSRRIFLSSTHVDLLPYREQIRDVLGRMDQFPVTTAHSETPDGEPTSVALEQLASSEAYIGIVAWRYGSLPPGETRSVTHLEYLEAKRLGLPCFLFLADDQTGHDDGPNALFPTATRDPIHRQQLLAFREAIKQEQGVVTFTTPDDLATKVAAVLNGYLLKKQEEEWRNRPRPPHILPLAPASFVGRERELQIVVEALRPGQPVAPAVALVGMGGVGKSALAAQAVHRLTEDETTFPGGVTWVRCNERQGFAGLVWVYDQLLAAWNISIAPEERGRAATDEDEANLRERVLRTRLQPASSSEPPPPALVLLDNVEYDLPLHRALITLGALNMSILLTIRAEPASSRPQLVPLDVLEPEPARHLFASHYKDRGGAWELTRDEPPAAAVVAALGYLPLAILLAAARAARTHLSVVALAQEFEQPGLLSRLKDPLKKSESVRYSFERSLTLLTPAQRVRFVALGLPDGPDWPRPVIEQMLSTVPPDDREANPPEDDLELLTALSLITLLPPELSPDNTAQAAARPIAPRVRLHPLLQELAREEWARQPKKIQALALGALLDAVGALILEAPRDFARLAREEALIAGTIRRVSSQRIKLPELNTTIQMLFDYIQLGGHWRLGLELFTLQRNARRDLGDRPGEGAVLIKLGGLAMALGRSEQAIWTLELAVTTLEGDKNQAMRAMALGTLGTLADMLGQREAARRYTEQAMVEQQQSGNRLGEALAHQDLALTAFKLGHRDEALQHEQAALAAAQQIDSLRDRGTAIHHLGNLAKLMGRLEEAQHHYEQALLWLRESHNQPEGHTPQNNLEHLLLTSGDRQDEGATLKDLGQLLQMRGKHDEAAHAYLDALAFARRVGDRGTESDALESLGTLARVQGRNEDAAGYYQQALTVAHDLGDRRRELELLRQQGQLSQATGNPADAILSCEQALSISREIGEHPQEAATLILLGRLASESDQPAQAFAYFEQALPLERALGEPAGLLTTLSGLGAMAQLLGRPADSMRFFEEALPLALAADDLLIAATCLMGLGTQALELGQQEDASRFLQQSLALQQQIGNQQGTTLVLGLLAAQATQQGKLEEALPYYQQRLALLQVMQDQEEITQTLLTLGALAQKLKRPEEALGYLEEALPRMRAAGDQENEALTLTRIGMLVKGLGRLEEAAGAMHSALAIEHAAGRKRNEGIISLQLGNLAHDQQQLQEAAHCYQQALQCFQEIGDQALVTQAQEKIAALDLTLPAPPRSHSQAE